MQRELVKYILARRLKTDSAVERRINIIDRRTSWTYIKNDRRSGRIDRRATISELMKRSLFGYNIERRYAKRDRRKLNTYINNDRRSGICDRRSGCWKRK